MQPTNTTYNAFSGPAPASNDNAFQSAIDYLIANRQKPVFNNQGLFTQGSNNTESKSSVMTDLFGDQYIKRSQGDSGGGGADSFVGNPNTAPRNGLSSLADAARYQELASGIRNNMGQLGGVFGVLSQANPVFGAIGAGVRYGAPKLFDFLGDRAYQQYGQEMQQIGGELFNPANPNLAALAWNQPDYDAYRSDAPPVPSTPYTPEYDFNYAGGSDSGGGGWSDAGGGVVGSTDTGYDGNW